MTDPSRPRRNPDAEARTSLSAGLKSPRRARRFVESTLRTWGCQRLIDPMALVASELVTNAVVHARSASEMTLRRTDEMVRLELADQDPAPPRRHPVPDDGTRGRGLLLVDAIADRWGTDGRDGGKVVWVELDVQRRA